MKHTINMFRLDIIKWVICGRVISKQNFSHFKSFDKTKTHLWLVTASHVSWLEQPGEVSWDLRVENWVCSYRGEQFNPIP